MPTRAELRNSVLSTRAAALVFSLLLHVALVGIVRSRMPIARRQFGLAEVTLLPDLNRVVKSSASRPRLKTGARKQTVFSVRTMSAKAAPTEVDSGTRSDSTESLDSPSGIDGQKSIEGIRTYQAEIRYEIEKHKIYPSIARLRKQQGQVEVRFTVLRDGSLRDVRFQRLSLFSALNASAFNAVLSVGKFKPFPADIGSNSLDFVVPINFVLN